MNASASVREQIYINKKSNGREACPIPRFPPQDPLRVREEIPREMIFENCAGKILSATVNR